ncbi:MAG: hypothetical protein OXI71_01585 [Gemmatimonadota bacterium]|nr:hypothetical protein [Gemmatimonadota bacterium]
MYADYRGSGLRQGSALYVTAGQLVEAVAVRGEVLLRADLAGYGPL